MTSSRRSIHSFRVALIVAASLGGPAQAVSQARRPLTPAAVARMAAAIDSIADTFRRDEKLPGLTVAITTARGDVLYANGYGSADRASRKASTSRTPYRIYSISKVYAAALAHQLAEAGQLSLDAPVGRYLINLPAWRDTVTVRQLLAHTAGIAEYTDVEGYETSASSGRSEDDHFATLALELPLQFPPGTQWRYSNTGYWLLQKVIERVTVDSLPHALASRILTPAGLAETSPDCPLERIATGYTAAWRLGLRGDSIVDSPSRNAHRYNLAAAGLCSTATDVARFLGSVVSGSIIGSASLADMTERVPASARSGAGLFVQEDSEGLIFSHSGGGGNGNSEVMAFPRDSLVFAAITNTGGTDLERLIRDLRRQVLGVPQPIVLDLPMKREEWLPILGTYLDPLSRQRVMVVSERAGAPYGFGGRLRKQADGSYVSEGYRDQRLTFPVLPDGTTEVVITAFGVVVQRGQRRP